MYKSIGIIAFSVVMPAVAFMMDQVGLDQPWAPFVFTFSGAAVIWAGNKILPRLPFLAGNLRAAGQGPVDVRH